MIGFFLQDTGGAEVIYHVGSQDYPTLLLFHGCAHKGVHFFPPSEGCPPCEGLPEDMAIVKSAVAANYNVLAFTSLDRRSGCWSAADVELVTQHLAQVRAHTGLSEAGPLYGIGASSGGSFLLLLALTLRFDAIVPMIASRPAARLPDPPLVPFPPTLFVHMSRDARMAARVATNIEVRCVNGQCCALLKLYFWPVLKHSLRVRLAALAGTCACSICDLKFQHARANTCRFCYFIRIPVDAAISFEERVFIPWS